MSRPLFIRPSAHSFTLRGHKFFKKQLSLEQDPSHTTRQQDNILQNRRFFLP